MVNKEEATLQKVKDNKLKAKKNKVIKAIKTVNMMIKSNINLQNILALKHLSF